MQTTEEHKAAIKSLKTIKKKVEYIFEYFPRSRNSIAYVQVLYWRYNNDLPVWFEDKDIWGKEKLPDYTTIVRMRQILQGDGYFLPTDPAVLKRRRRGKVQPKDYFADYPFPPRATTVLSSPIPIERATFEERVVRELDDVRERIAYVASQHEHARNDDVYLAFLVWKTMGFEPKFPEGFIPKEGILPPLSTPRRIVQIIQNIEKRFPPSDETQRYRRRKEEVYREYFKGDD